MIVAPYSEDIVADLSTLGDKFRLLARNILGHHITTDPHLGYVVLILNDMRIAQDYLAAFGVNASAISGVFLGGAAPHIVMHDAKRFHLRLTFLHELNHALLHHLPIPTWVHEGLSRYFEARLLSISQMQFTAEMNLGRNRYWRQHGLADFWNGAIFYDNRALWGYVLAHKIVLRLMKSSPEKFTQFMLKANRRDAGDAACREVFGVGILDFARDLLGAGEWEGPIITESP